MCGRLHGRRTRVRPDFKLAPTQPSCRLCGLPVDFELVLGISCGNGRAKVSVRPMDRIVACAHSLGIGRSVEPEKCLHCAENPRNTPVRSGQSRQRGQRKDRRSWTEAASSHSSITFNCMSRRASEGGIEPTCHGCWSRATLRKVTARIQYQPIITLETVYTCPTSGYYTSRHLWCLGCNRVTRTVTGFRWYINHPCSWTCNGFKSKELHRSLL